MLATTTLAFISSVLCPSLAYTEHLHRRCTMSDMHANRDVWSLPSYKCMAGGLSL